MDYFDKGPRGEGDGEGCVAENDFVCVAWPANVGRIPHASTHSLGGHMVIDPPPPHATTFGPPLLS